MEYLITWLLAWLITGSIFGAITRYVANSKGYDGGFAWGFWLGIIGILVVGFRPNLEQQSQRYSGYKPMYPEADGYVMGRQGTSSQEGWTCICGAKNSTSISYCLSCRRSKDEAQEKQVKCKECGSNNNEGNTFCWICNALLPGKTAPVLIERQEDHVGEDAGKDDGYESVLMMIEKLADLKQRSLLNDEEFQTKKKQLLEKL